MRGGLGSKRGRAPSSSSSALPSYGGHRGGRCCVGGRGAYLLPVLLIVRHLLATGAAGGVGLGPRLLLLARQLLLGGLDLDGVAKGVGGLLLALPLQLRRLQGRRGLAGDLALAAAHVPLLRAHLVDELVVVRHDNHAAAVLLEGAGHGAQRLAVQVVGGLIQHQDVGLLPHGGAQHQLHLLATRQAADLGVGGELGGQAQVGQHLLHVLGGQGLAQQAGGGRLLHVDVGEHLLEAHLLEPVAGQPRGLHLALPLHLVLVATLLLAAAQQLLHHALHAVDHLDLVHLLLLLLLELARHLVQGLAVLAGGVTPLDVLVGGHVQVVLNVVEGVLRHVGHPQVGVLPHQAGLGLQLAGQQLDEGGLAGTVGAQHSHARVQRHLQVDLVQDAGLGGGVLEVDGAHLEDGAVLGGDALEVAGLGQHPLGAGVGQVVVGSGLGALLHKLGQVAQVLLQLEVVLVVDNAAAHGVQEARVVRHHHAGHPLEADQVVDQPLDVGHVQVVGGLIQQHDVGVHQHGARQRQLHLPAARQGGHGQPLAVGIEAHRLQHLDDALAGGQHLLDHLVVHHKLHHRGLGLGGIDVVLDVHGAQLRLGREAVQLAVGDGAHEGGLAGAVGAAQAVALAALQVQAGIVQQDLATVGQGELAVAQVLALLLLHGGHHAGLGLLEAGGVELLAHGGRAGVAREGRQVGHHSLGPLGLLKVLDVNQVGGHAGHVAGRLLSALALDGHRRGVGGLVQGRQHLLHGGLGGRLYRGVDALQDLVAVGGHLAGLGVGHALHRVLDVGQQRGHKVGSVHGVVHQLGHVADDDAGLAADGGGAVGQAADEQGHQDGQGARVHRLHEGGGRQLVDAVGHLAGGADTADQVRHEGLDVAVADGSAALGQRVGGGGAHGGLQVHHAVGHDRNNLGQVDRDLLGRGGGQVAEELGGSLLGLPLGVGHGLEQGRERQLHGVAVQRRRDGQAGGVGSGAHGGILVRGRLQHRGQVGDEVNLSSRALAGRGSQGLQGGGAGDGELSKLLGNSGRHGSTDSRRCPGAGE
uniref:Uncharacterized protein n=2 Tax=Noccaea caerulescens TaxID=107243 RepID=A0A1J3GZS4_NOCCA